MVMNQCQVRIQFILNIEYAFHFIPVEGYRPNSSKEQAPRESSNEETGISFFYFELYETIQQTWVLREYVFNQKV